MSLYWDGACPKCQGENMTVYRGEGKAICLHCGLEEKYLEQEKKEESG